MRKVEAVAAVSLKSSVGPTTFFSLSRFFSPPLGTRLNRLNGDGSAHLSPEQRSAKLRAKPHTLLIFFLWTFMDSVANATTVKTEIGYALILYHKLEHPAATEFDLDTPFSELDRGN
jgi:hypothetical protein